MASSASAEKGNEARLRSPPEAPIKPKQYEEIRPAKDECAKSDDKDVEAVDTGVRPELSRQKSSAATSVVTTTPSTNPPPQKPWYKQPNPLRWGKISPPPQERGPSPENKAGFLSVLIFNWMSPLMRVRETNSLAQGLQTKAAEIVADMKCRRVTGAN